VPKSLLERSCNPFGNISDSGVNCDEISLSPKRSSLPFVLPLAVRSPGPTSSVIGRQRSIGYESS
jgi:hypothetical protein